MGRCVPGTVLTTVGQNSRPVSIAARSVSQNLSFCSRRRIIASTLLSSETFLPQFFMSPPRLHSQHPCGRTRHIPENVSLNSPARSSRSSNVGAFAAGAAKRTGDFVPVLVFEQRNKPTVHSPQPPQTDFVTGATAPPALKSAKPSRGLR